MEPTNVGKIFAVKFIRVKYFRTFPVYENILTTKIKRITVLSVLHAPWQPVMQGYVIGLTTTLKQRVLSTVLFSGKGGFK